MANSPIKPLADRVVAVREAVKEKTASGIFLPEAAKESPVLAEIVAAGPDVKAVKVGDKVIHKNYSSTDISIDNVEYLIIKEEDILATA